MPSNNSPRDLRPSSHSRRQTVQTSVDLASLLWPSSSTVRPRVAGFTLQKRWRCKLARLVMDWEGRQMGVTALFMQTADRQSVKPECWFAKSDQHYIMAAEVTAAGCPFTLHTAVVRPCSRVNGANNMKHNLPHPPHLQPSGPYPNPQPGSSLAGYDNHPIRLNPLG
ncbi:hypothetical protein ACOMHN_067718 [Nucella lapillus]